LFQGQSAGFGGGEDDVGEDVLGQQVFGGDNQALFGLGMIENGGEGGEKLTQGERAGEGIAIVGQGVSGGHEVRAKELSGESVNVGGAGAADVRLGDVELAGFGDDEIHVVIAAVAGADVLFADKKAGVDHVGGDLVGKDAIVNGHAPKYALGSKTHAAVIKKFDLAGFGDFKLDVGKTAADSGSWSEIVLNDDREEFPVSVLFKPVQDSLLASDVVGWKIAGTKD